MIAAYIFSLLYTACNVFAISQAIERFLSKHYGWFGFYISLTILNVFMMARLIFCES